MNAKITHNTRQGGIEIRFDARPDDKTLSWLHERRYRWSRSHRVWYKKYNEYDYNKAFEYFEGEKPSRDPQAPTTTVEPPKSAPAEVVVRDLEYYQKIMNQKIEQQPGLKKLYRMAKQPLLEWFREINYAPVTIATTTYTWDAKKKAYSYLPPKRKRPDYYHPEQIHNRITTHLLRQGFIIPWEVLFSQRNNHSKTKRHIDGEVRIYPQQQFAEDYQKVYKEILKIEDAHALIFQHWKHIREKYFKAGQMVWVQDKEKGQWEDWKVVDLDAYDTGPGYRTDTVNLERNHGWIIFHNATLMDRIYLKTEFGGRSQVSFKESLPQAEREPIVQDPNVAANNRQHDTNLALARLRLAKKKRINQSQINGLNNVKSTEMPEIQKLDEVVGEFDYLLQEGVILSPDQISRSKELTVSLARIIDEIEGWIIFHKTGKHPMFPKMKKK